MSGAQATTETAKHALPSSDVLMHCAKIGIVEDKPIMMDYWIDSIEGRALIGVREDGEKLLVKNEEEYTSPIAKIFKVSNEFIVMTENSIYIVSQQIPSKRIS
jgi:hypothetical protein